MPASLKPLGSLSSETLRGLATAVLLAVAFLGYVTLAATVATHDADPQIVGRVQRAFVVYARTMLVKGLMPQLAGTLILWNVAERVLGERARWTRLLSLFVCASVAHLLVVQLLLQVDHPGMPAVKFTGLGNRIQTWLEMTLAVVAAVAAVRITFAPRPAPRPGT